MIYFTSDLHFGHNKDFLYSPRGFDSISKHDQVIIDNWNSVVSDADTVYVLGDLVLNDLENGYNCLNQLNGHIKYITGNHDTDNKINNIYNKLGLEYLGYSNILKYGKYKFYLSHYPTLVHNHDDKDLKHSIINLCGHSHTNNKFQDWDKGRIYHCELDAHNNYPVDIDTIIDDLEERYEIDKRATEKYY